MKSLLNQLTKPIAAPQTAAKVAQVIVYALSLLIFTVGVIRLPALGLDESQLFVATLALTLLLLTGVVIGTLIEWNAKRRAA